MRTPHIGGIVEAYRLVEDRFELVASQPGYRSHQLGSSNLDMALLADLVGDGRLEIDRAQAGHVGRSVCSRARPTVSRRSTRCRSTVAW